MNIIACVNISNIILQYSEVHPQYMAGKVINKCFLMGEGGCFYFTLDSPP